jgi:hypothetical protein
MFILAIEKELFAMFSSFNGSSHLYIIAKATCVAMPQLDDALRLCFKKNGRYLWLPQNRKRWAGGLCVDTFRSHFEKGF